MRDLFVLVCFLLVWPEKNWITIIGENQYQLFGSAFGVISSWLAEWRGKERSDSYKRIKKNFVSWQFHVYKNWFSLKFLEFPDRLTRSSNWFWLLLHFFNQILEVRLLWRTSHIWGTWKRWYYPFTLWRRSFLFPRFDLL